MIPVIKLKFRISIFLLKFYSENYFQQVEHHLRNSGFSPPGWEMANFSSVINALLVYKYQHAVFYVCLQEENTVISYCTLR